MKCKIYLMLRQVVPLLCLVLAVSFAPVELQAQKKDGKKSERKTKKAQSMGQKTYEALTSAQELIEAKQYDQGLEVLRELERQKKLTPYEKAQLYNYFAYTYFTLEKYSIIYFSY